MRTSKEWWNEVKNDDAKFNEWLRKQYHGEFLAWKRISEFAESMENDSRWKLPTTMVAIQEMKHAALVGELLLNRGIIPQVLENKQERYWEKALDGVTTTTEIAAQAAWAELMRLERIRVIANDIDMDGNDISEVFNTILVDEEFHARFFSDMAGSEAMKAGLAKHEAGMSAINLQMEGNCNDLIPKSAVV